MKVFLPDGRALRFWSSATDGPIVLFFHGCPDSRRIAMTGDPGAREAGVRLLAFNRPGYGSSTPTETTHTSVARDAADLLDIWSIDRVAVLGMSVGGPYAAAFAATFPERTSALGLVSAPAMVESSEANAGETVEDTIARVRPEFEAWRAALDPDDLDDAALAARFLAQLPPSDAALLTEAAQTVGPGLDFESPEEFLAAIAGEATIKPEGYLRDAALLQHPWDFEVADVRCPVSVWAGGLDERAVAATRWWAGRLPQAQVSVLPDTTHLAALLARWPVILGWLRTARG